MTVEYIKNSPYSTTKQVTNHVQYLDMWSPPSLNFSSKDQYIVLPTKYKSRPDLLSWDIYGTTRLWWVFAMYNPDMIRDPVYDMIPGIVLLIPAAEQFKGIN